MIADTAGTIRAVLVNIDFRSQEFNEDVEEFVELVTSSGIHPSHIISCHKDSPNPKYFIGEGKLQEIQAAVNQEFADLVIFNHSISASQERNLEQALGCRVIDRVELILDIFAQRARSYEGKLQVELAQLQHISTRLIRGWTHLERQKGGIGLRGPGETQLETDRRLIGKRIRTINTRLAKVRSQRRQGAKKRIKSALPLVSMVGYTNAGKSTLFNKITGAGVYTADKLFATLDPTLRSFTVAPDVSVILADTVGFIRHIPHHLIDAFHATLEETRQADLLLHIVDTGNNLRHTHIEQVNQVIRDIGAGHIPQIEVYNKIDLNGAAPRMETDENGLPHRVWLSARTGDGIDFLQQAVCRFITSKLKRHRLILPASAGKLRAQLFNIGAVENEHIDKNGDWIMQVNMETPRLQKLCRDSGVMDIKLQSYQTTL